MPKKSLWFLMFVLTAFVLVSYSACAQVPEEVSYGDHPQQKMDIYVSWPGAPTIVMVHGGGFARGDKRRPYGNLLFEHIRELLLGSGYSVVAINYRLAADHSLPPEHPFDSKYPAAHNDVAAALEWVRVHGAEYGLSWPVGIVGESAGGSLAARAAMSTESCGYMDIGGYFDLPSATSPIVLSIAENYMGCSYSECPKLWHEASATNSGPFAVQALLWHGDSDTIIDYGQMYALAERIAALAQSSGAPAPPTVARIISGAGHTGLPGFATPENDAEILAFFGATCQRKQYSRRTVGKLGSDQGQHRVHDLALFFCH